MEGMIRCRSQDLDFSRYLHGCSRIELDRKGSVEIFKPQNNQLALAPAAAFFETRAYIESNPNFMSKNTAQQLEMRTATFLGYLFRYTLPILGAVTAFVSPLSLSPRRFF
jgi:Putative citrate transport